MDLSVAAISHWYGGTNALQNVSFDVKSGEVVCLIGPSGCGKSTLLGIIGGLIAPSSGEVRLRGAPPAGSLNPLTYVFQDFALLPWRTVRGNVALALEEHKLPAGELASRVGRALAMCGLSDFAEALPGQLSGGMKQRVGIARAIAVTPAVLLLDEPLSALDAQTRDLLIEDLLEIFRRESATGIWVTHNLDEALRVGDKVVVLSRRPGRLKKIVPVDIPRDQRVLPESAAEMARLHNELWSLIKAEAVMADREVADV
ncbi:ABC transporter ATP-binding protein [Bradyrhizobium sp. 38]|uniref:ABC transporter ATP-binding protein n=1 Tax=unclassified Bradyrhizobium TaxID=2631580 RepID=UPI001FF89371|nr:MULTISPECIES: ABC transporter ATP-binding protein [unclassified Bradyrhizobium]MCK1339478.1 ABC transporter ATP-binding protein [Bradyrhizobium sp. 38]MCK1778017.1 ABC transporter ATP-binding protein [Bradyrhizobium sp. 132]